MTPSLSIPPLADFERFRLDNGLEVLLHRDESVPLAAVNLWYHVGSKDEPPTCTGLAHLLEHLMFEGSAKRNGDFFAPIEEAGGAVNGSTSQDRTNYYELVPSNYLEAVLELEADRMAHLAPALTDEKLEVQRRVVMNERRQRVENQPYGRAAEALAECAFPAGHPYSWPVIGSMAHLERLSLADVKDFCARYYRPANAALVVAGSFDPALARRWIERQFGAIAPGRRAALPDAPPVGLEREVRQRLEDRVALVRLDLAWPGAPRHSADEPALDYLAEILGGRSKDSRLKRRLVHERRLATSVVAYHAGYRLAGLFGIRAYGLRNVAARQLEPLIDEELARLRHEPPSADEMLRARNEFFNHLVARMETVLGIADALNQLYFYSGDATAEAFRTELARYARVTADDVQRAAREYLGPARAVVEVHPAGDDNRSPGNRPAASVSKADERDGRHAPMRLAASGPEPRCRFPLVDRLTLANGMRLAVVRRTKMPLVQCLAVIDAGSVCDPTEKAGLARLTADMLDEGTTERDALAIARQLDQLGTRLSISVGHESMTIGLRTLRPSIDPSFAILGEIVRRPRFAESDCERTKRQLLAELAHLQQQPAYVADCTAQASVFGTAHPYGRPSNGDLETVTAIGPADLTDFHRRRFRPDRFTLVAAGDMTLDELARLAERHFGDWESLTTPADPIVPLASPQPAARLVRVERPGSAQAVIRIAVPAVPRKSPAYFPLLLLNTVLGGQFSSRLNRNLREQKGCTYGARSELALRRRAGTMVLAADVDGGSVGLAVRDCLDELARIKADRPVTDAELDAAKSYLCRRFPSRFETVGQIVVQMAQLAVYDLADDFYETYQASVANVELREVEAAVRLHLATASAQVVVLGDSQDLATVDDRAILV